MYQTGCFALLVNILCMNLLFFIYVLNSICDDVRDDMHVFDNYMYEPVDPLHCFTWQSTCNVSFETQLLENGSQGRIEEIVFIHIKHTNILSIKVFHDLFHYSV